MVDQSIIMDIWMLTKHDVSKADVRQILEEYEKRKVPKVKTNRDTSLRADEVYVIRDAYTETSNEYFTLDEVKKRLDLIQRDRDWDSESFDDNITIYIRREDCLELIVENKGFEYNIS
jgi:transcriptional regulator of heat shock response